MKWLVIFKGSNGQYAILVDDELSETDVRRRMSVMRSSSSLRIVSMSAGGIRLRTRLNTDRALDSASRPSCRASAATRLRRADLRNDRVIPFFDEHGIPLSSIAALPVLGGLHHQYVRV